MSLPKVQRAAGTCPPATAAWRSRAPLRSGRWTALYGATMLATSVACTPYSPPEIEAYRPQAIALQATLPVYFAVGDDLHFSRDGKVSPGGRAIWHGPRDGVWVAPDSAHLIVLSESSLKLLDQQGHETKRLSPAYRIFSERPAGQDTYWDAESIQWAADSDAIFLLRRSGNAVGPVALYRYRLGDPAPRELTQIAHPPRNFVPSDGLFQSDSGDAVYYQLAARDDDYALYRYDVATGATTTVRDVRNGVARTDGLMPLPAHVFCDFQREDLAGRNGVGWSWVRSSDLSAWLVLARSLDPQGDECVIFTRRGDTLRPVLRTRKSSGSYSGSVSMRDCGVYLDQSYFLPGGRQALVKVDTRQHRGLLVVDTEEPAYGAAPDGLEVFFPLHARNVSGLEILPSGGPILDDGLDFDALEQRLRATLGGEPGRLDGTVQDH